MPYVNTTSASSGPAGHILTALCLKAESVQTIGQLINRLRVPIHRFHRKGADAIARAKEVRQKRRMRMLHRAEADEIADLKG